jgi:dTDP-L-rhamnose 4-epimerase
MKNVLITGGAGFIGSHLCRKLLEKNYSVTLLDNLSPQIHGNDFRFIAPKNVRFVKGDVRNKNDWEKVLKDINIVVHYAAETGTGQSMYEVYRYTDHNINGTALLLDYVVNESHSIEKIIVASSRAVYGEGKYQCAQHGIIFPDTRKERDLIDKRYEPLCPVCEVPLHLMPTDETSKVHPASVYGITKLTQEQMVLNVCGSVNIPAIAYRYQNVFGPGQSLKNPYTGILSIFSTLMRNGKIVNIFEDGNESRDFVYVDDVVNATVLGIESKIGGQEVYNVGSGIATSVIDVAEKLKELYEVDIDISVSGNYRLGDIRHNIADLSKIGNAFGYKPAFSFDEGIVEFTKWVLTQEVPQDRYNQSINEMKLKGLLK